MHGGTSRRSRGRARVFSFSGSNLFPTSREPQGRMAQKSAAPVFPGGRRIPMKASNRAALMAAVAAAALAAVFARRRARPAASHSLRRRPRCARGAGARGAPPRLAGIRAVRLGTRRAQARSAGPPTTGTADSLLMTPVDALDTLLLLGLKDEAARAQKLIVEKLSFDQDISVKNFEITIRILGGLLSAYQMTGDARLLSLAEDLGTRLLPRFRLADRDAVHVRQPEDRQDVAERGRTRRRSARCSSSSARSRS